jgi:ribosomal protein S18 acetylase RimI-like enzyme
LRGEKQGIARVFSRQDRRSSPTREDQKTSGARIDRFAEAARPLNTASPATPATEQLDCRLIGHGPLALRLRWRLGALQSLLDRHSSWAAGRSRAELAQMLRHSQAVVSVWRGRKLVGFGRATSDGVFRAVLWDVVVAGEHQGEGLGRRIVEALLRSPAVERAERVYLMTTNSSGFYRRLGFNDDHGQELLLRAERGR